MEEEMAPSSPDPFQELADADAGFAGVLGALVADICARDKVLAESFAATLSLLIKSLPDEKKSSRQGRTIARMQEIAEEAILRGPP